MTVALIVIMARKISRESMLLDLHRRERFRCDASSLRAAARPELCVDCKAIAPGGDTTHSRQAAIPQRCTAAMCLQLPGTRDEGL